MDSVSSVYSKWVLLYIALSLFLMLFDFHPNKKRKKGRRRNMNELKLHLTDYTLFVPFF